MGNLPGGNAPVRVTVYSEASYRQKHWSGSQKLNLIPSGEPSAVRGAQTLHPSQGLFRREHHKLHFTGAPTEIQQ